MERKQLKALIWSGILALAALIVAVVVVANAAPVYTSPGLDYVNTSGYTSFSAAHAAAVAAGRGIKLNSNVTLSTATTVTVPITVVKGGMLTLSSSVTVTLPPTFTAERFKVLTVGTGTFKFGVGTTEIYPEWWGLVTNDVAAAAQNTVALQAAVNAAAGLVAGGSKVVVLPAGVISKDNVVTVPPSVIVRGQGSYWNGGTIVKNTDSSKNGFVLSNDGNYVGANGLSKMIVESSNIGITATEANYITIDDVIVQLNTTGYQFTGVQESTFRKFLALWNVTGGIETYSGVRYSDSNVWDSCSWMYNTGTGHITRRAFGNTYIGPRHIGNTGLGWLIDTDVATNDANFLYPPTHTIGGTNTVISPYFEDKWLGGNLQPVLKLVNAWNWKFLNGFFINYDTKTNGFIQLSRSAKVQISGLKMESSFTTPATNFVNADETCWEVELDIDGTSKAGMINRGINSGSKTVKKHIAYDDETDKIANAFLSTAGTGTALLDTWATFGTGTLSLDTAASALFYPRSLTTQSLKIESATPATTTGIAQSSNLLLANKRYYLNLVYKNDSALTKPLAPLAVLMANVGDGLKNYNWNNRTWTGDGSDYLLLPIVEEPYTISIPFAAPSNTTSIYLSINAPSLGGSGDGAVHHVYSASIDTEAATDTALIPAIAKETLRVSPPVFDNLITSQLTSTYTVVKGLTANSVPFLNTNKYLTEGNLVFSGDSLQVGVGTATYPSVKVDGSSAGDLKLKHSGAGADVKEMLIRSSNGTTTFGSLTDAGGYKVSNILSLDHATGEITAKPFTSLTVTNLTANSVPVVNASRTLYSSSLTYTNGLLNIGTGTDAYATALISGTTAADLKLQDTGAAADKKTLLVRSNDGSTNFSSLTDAGGYTFTNILTMDHTTGQVGIQNLSLTVTSAPTSTTEACTTGTIKKDSNYIYVCVSTDTWKRAALSTW